MLKMVDGTGIIGVDMVCPLGGAVSPPQPPNYDNVEMEGVGSLTLPNSLIAPLERLELIGNNTQGENPAPDNPQEIKSAGRWNEGTQKYEIDVKVTGKNLFPYSNDFSNWKKYVNNSYFGSVTSDESGIKAEALKPYAKIVSPTFKLKPITEYTISAMIDTKDKSMSLGVRIFKNLNVSDYLKQIVFARRKSTNNPQKVSATFITDDLKDTNEVYLQLDCSWGDSVLPTIVTFYDIQLELGNNATNYEPYTEQTLTLTSDRPLTKWDKLVEQGGQYGWLYQSASDTDVKPSRLDLFPNGFSLFKDFGNGVYVYKVTNIKKAIGFQTSLCEQFKNKDGSYSAGDLFCYSDQPSMQMQYFVTDIPTLEEFKTWMEANSLTTVYKTTQTEFVPLSQEEQTQLRNLHSYNGTTNITVDSGEVPCGIKLTYRKEI